MSGRCLIVANQTLGGEALNRSVKDCITRDVRIFYVVVPLTRVEHETTAWSGGFALVEGGWLSEESRAAVEAAMEETARRHEAEFAEARRRAQDRFRLMIEEIEFAGGHADGEVGLEDPLEATRAVLKSQPPFDEIIVSTLPGGLSRWLKMDLPNRIARLTDVPVTTVEATSR